MLLRLHLMVIPDIVFFKWLLIFIFFNSPFTQQRHYKKRCWWKKLWLYYVGFHTQSQLQIGSASIKAPTHKTTQQYHYIKKRKGFRNAFKRMVVAVCETLHIPAYLFSSTALINNGVAEWPHVKPLLINRF